MSIPRPLPGLILLCILALIAGAALLILTPRLAQSNVEKRFTSLGFTEVILPAPSASIGSLTYHDIALDANGLNTLDTLTVKYDLLSMLFSVQMKSLHIEGLRLVGESAIEDGVTIAGKTNSDFETLLRHMLKFEEVKIDNAAISLLSAQNGGISMTFEGLATKSKNGTESYFTLINTQKQMRYHADIKAQINSNLTWHAEAEISDIRLETPQIKATRASGEVKLLSQTHEAVNINGELRAGNAIIAGLPWENPSMTLQGNLNAPSLILGTKASGFESIEMGLALNNIHTPAKLTGYLYTETAGQLLTYLAQNGYIEGHQSAFEPLNDIKSIQLAFERNDNNLEFQIETANPALALSGYAELGSPEGKLTLKTLALKSTAPGRVSLTDKNARARIQTSAEEKQLILKALENLHYTEMTLHGPLNDLNALQLNATIKGSNPSMENGRPFTMTFVLEGSLKEIVATLGALEQKEPS